MRMAICALMHIDGSLRYIVHCMQLETYKNLCSSAVKDMHKDVKAKGVWKELAEECSQRKVPDLKQQMVTILKQAVKGELHYTHVTFQSIPFMMLPLMLSPV